MQNNELRTTIQQRLDQFSQRKNKLSELTPAAVVIGIAAMDNTTSPCILLTQRSSKLRKHASQFALPGGKVDDGETVVEAALRELKEELGLSQNDNSVLGSLDDMPTQSGFNITPIVVWIEDLQNLKANPDEVAEVYQIPLTELQAIELNLSREEDDHNIKPGEDAMSHTDTSENDVMSLYLPSVGTTVYSPTAAIIYQFREVALQGKSTRVAHFGQPRFAWR